MNKYTVRRHYLLKRNPARGFTLVELLVVIAIIVLLAAFVFVIINPPELARRTRDNTRISDLGNLQQALTNLQEINPSPIKEASGSTDLLCASGLTSGVCQGKSNDSGSDTKSIDGKGWVKVNLAVQKSYSLPELPLDPTNNGQLHYTYCSDGTSWEINTVLESQQQKDKMAKDTGDENDVAAKTAKYEIGSKLDLISANGACTF